MSYLACYVSADSKCVIWLQVQPSPWTLRTLQDKFVQKDHLASNGIAVVDYRKVTDAVRAARLSCTDRVRRAAADPDAAVLPAVPRNSTFWLRFARMLRCH